MRGPAWYTADRDLIVAEGDERAAFLAAGPGDDVPTDVPWDLGSDEEKPAVAATPVEKPAAARKRKPKKD